MSEYEYPFTDLHRRVSDNPINCDYSLRGSKRSSGIDTSAERSSADHEAPLPKWEGEEPSTETFTVAYRPFEPTDERVIRKSWFLKAKSDAGNWIPADIFTTGMHNRFNLLASRALTIIACDEQVPAFVLGYLIFSPLAPPITSSSPLLVHWLYIKQAYRKQGIASGLLRQAGWHPGRPVHATSFNRECKQYARTHKGRLHYNPFALDALQ